MKEMNDQIVRAYRQQADLSKQPRFRVISLTKIGERTSLLESETHEFGLHIWGRNHVVRNGGKV